MVTSERGAIDVYDTTSIFNIFYNIPRILFSAHREGTQRRDSSVCFIPALDWIWGYFAHDTPRHILISFFFGTSI